MLAIYLLLVTTTYTVAKIIISISFELVIEVLFKLTGPSNKSVTQFQSEILPNDHGVLHRDLHCPGLPSQLAVHLQSYLGSHGHQSLGFVEDRGSHHLAWHWLLNATLGLDGSVVL